MGKLQVKKLILALLLTIVFAMLGVHEYFASYGDIGITQAKVENNEGSIGNIWNGRVIEQTFTTDEDFYGVALLMGTYGKFIQVGDIEVTVTDADTGEVVVDATRRMESMKDNTYVYFVGDDLIKVDGEKEYIMTITGKHVMKTCGVTIWATGEDDYKDGTLIYNDEYISADLCFSMVEHFYGGMQYHVFAKRLILLLILYVFFMLHVFLNIRSMYRQIYKYRWLIAFMIFVFCVLNKFNGSSLAQYDLYIQQGFGSEFVQPLFGQSRYIRSDEWLVSVPRIMSAEYTNYGLYNDIVMGTTHTNMSASGLYLSYSALAKPSDWGYYLFGSEYGLSYVWCFHIIFGFMFSYEFCYILAKKNKMVGLFGACLIWFSMFNMEWSIVTWIFAGQAALVMFYYFLSQEKLWKRALLGIGTALFAAEFIVNLYPAWQVPAGYIYLGILIWMFFSQKERWNKYKLKDWALAAACVIFMVSVVAAFVYNDLDYIREISNTVYPAGRVDYGGFKLDKLFGYLSSTLSPFLTYTNASEMACFFTLFPVPMILFFYVMVKKKGKSLLMWCLTVPTVFLTLYCTFELPHKLVELTLMTNSTSGRTVDIVGYANVLMLVVARSEYEDLKQMKWYVAAPITIASVAVSVYYAQGMDVKATIVYTIALAVFAMVVGTLLLARVKPVMKNAAMAGMAVVVFVTGMSFNPVQVGLDAITTKPVAAEIQKLMEEDPDAKWIGVNSNILGDYLVALGAKAINSTNYVPNMDLWHYFDPNETMAEIYNRYAHLTIETLDGDSSISLMQTDWIHLKLNYAQLEDLGIEYLFSTEELESDRVELEEVYGEMNAYIYKVHY